MVFLRYLNKIRFFNCYQNMQLRSWGWWIEELLKFLFFCMNSSEQDKKWQLFWCDFFIQVNDPQGISCFNEVVLSL